MRILLTNDDGILAPGLAAMYRRLTALGHVDVVAPESGQSAAAHSITVRYPIMSRQVHVGGEFHGYSVEGSPADCVKLAIHALLDAPPDLVVSGINAGENVGIHVLYSGTVAAAAEGALQGCRAIAVSLEYADELDFDRAAEHAIAVIRDVLDNGLAPGELVSINIPALRPGWPRGVRVAGQSTARLSETFERRNDPQGRPYYWLSGNLLRDVQETADTDLRAVREGYIAVTPLMVNLTDPSRLSAMRDWPWSWPQSGGGCGAAEPT
ncbi:MAG: 5'/3'-nucleotidase SurE [Phycisphaerae bacterium]|nr:5'/3'-nucleotidase SurE [Phycisphaerae bacterium]NUQ47016.1 5'/3'-nucleotidase SurE [Phycisphaerae bacterium]